MEDEKLERSRRYPATSLRDSVAMLDQVYKGVGLSGGSRETLAHALGHQSLNGTSKRKIATLVQFGLIEKDGERYRVSELGRRVLIPIDDGERRSALAEAVRQPALFSEVGAAYDGEPVPSMLANLIARQYGILPQASTEVASNFLESVAYAGLLEGGVLHWSSPATTPAPAPTQSAPTKTGAQAAQGGAAAHSARGEVQDYTIALNGSGRRAIIQLPVPLDGRDLDKVAAWVTYMRSVVEEPTGAS